MVRSTNNTPIGPITTSGTSHRLWIVRRTSRLVAGAPGARGSPSRRDPSAPPPEAATSQESIESPTTYSRQVNEPLPLIFDGLVVAQWGQETFEALRRGGISGINATCAVWENTEQTIRGIARWIRWFDEFQPLIKHARSVADIRAAYNSSKTAVVLGFQNTSPIEDDVDLIWLFRELGVGIMQLTYNTRNSVGSGCYDTQDSGLSEFGRKVVKELNRANVAIDLSHCSYETALDTVRTSSAPVAFSHVVPRELKNHPRNKRSHELELVAQEGGIVGITTFPSFLPGGDNSSIDDVVETMEWAIELCGEDAVTFGSDSTQGHGPEFFDWISHDKGSGAQLVDFGDIKFPAGLQRLEDTPNLVDVMQRRGWQERLTAKVLGENWLAFLTRVWQ